MASSRPLYRRNPLAYPAGGLPGIDPSHPASKNLVGSFLAFNAVYINLLKGIAGVINANITLPTQSIECTIGPSLTEAADGRIFGESVSGKTFNNLTMAGILRYGSTNAGNQCVVSLDDQNGLFIRADVPSLLTDGWYAASTALTPNTPYFVAASTKLTSGSPIYHVITNLNTGQIFATVATQTGTAISGRTGVCVGNEVGGHNATFPIAAGMFSDTLLSMPQLLQWANDPWAFWYPRQTEMLGAAVTILLYLRPDADSIDGSWTNELGGTELFASIDENSVSDTDYIQSSINPSSDLAKIRLSNPSTSVAQPVKLRYRYKRDSTRTADLTVRLLQGAVEIASWTHTDISTSFVTTEQTLTAPQFAAISDFDDLYIEFTANS